MEKNGFVYVSTANEASARMWENICWTKGWKVEWVYVGSDVQPPGVRADEKNKGYSQRHEARRHG